MHYYAVNNGYFILSTNLKLTKMSSKFRKYVVKSDGNLLSSFNTCSNIKSFTIIFLLFSFKKMAKTWENVYLKRTIVDVLIQSGMWSDFPDYGFPSYFCHSKHVFQRKLK